MAQKSETGHLNKWIRGRLLIVGGSLLLIFLIWYWFCLPDKLFDVKYSSVLRASDGTLLAARPAFDDQWRFPPSDSVPIRFKSALICFEDHRFMSHCGVSLRGVGRAVFERIRQSAKPSGGSTITMQVIRIAGGSKDRTYLRKLTETIKATRLEISHSKEEILAMWASHASFGGNVVGLEAASWRYFGRAPHLLSWAESATLAVLPNAPAIIHPGRNRALLKAKRDRLLNRMARLGYISPMECGLSVQEPLMPKPVAIPTDELPLLNSLIAHGGEGNLYDSNLDIHLQKAVREIIQNHSQRLYSEHINNMACVIIDHQSNEIKAYIGNVVDIRNRHSNQVDCARAPRSSGSLLKPFLYALAIDEGLITPKQLLADVPMSIGGFSPKNNSESYYGAVPADEALTASLNITAVKLLREYNEVRFVPALQQLGLSDINRPSGHYGLSLIVGGAESNLLDLSRAYAAIARSIFLFGETQTTSDSISTPALLKGSSDSNTLRMPFGVASGAIVLEMLRGLARPSEESGWQNFEDVSHISWKTGTSQGNRDAWAIGCNARFTVGIWAGNASGEGRSTLTGIGTAAGVLFDIFNLLPPSGPFVHPIDLMEPASICANSGYLTGPYCVKSDTLLLPAKRTKGSICPYHAKYFLDATGKRVTASCGKPGKATYLFSLPADMQWYYKPHHPEYIDLPSTAPGCAGFEDQVIKILTPVKLEGLVIPIEPGGKPGAVVFTAAHSLGSNRLIHWHLDDNYLLTTRGMHRAEIKSKPGRRNLTLTDDDGNHARFHVVFLSSSAAK